MVLPNPLTFGILLADDLGGTWMVVMSAVAP